MQAKENEKTGTGREHTMSRTIFVATNRPMEKEYNEINFRLWLEKSDVEFYRKYTDLPYIYYYEGQLGKVTGERLFALVKQQGKTARRTEIWSVWDPPEHDCGELERIECHPNSFSLKLFKAAFSGRYYTHPVMIRVQRDKKKDLVREMC